MKAIAAGLLACIVLGAVAVGSLAQTPEDGARREVRMAPGMQETDERDRGDVLEQLAEARAAFEAGGGDSTRFAYANLLLEAGSFEAAREVASPLLDSEEPSPDAVRLVARLAYFVGDYVESERLFSELVEKDPNNPRAAAGLFLTYYQTNQFAKARERAGRMGGAVRIPALDVMNMFVDETPYLVEWDGDSSDGPGGPSSRVAATSGGAGGVPSSSKRGSRTAAAGSDAARRVSVVPFVSGDPLPVIEVELDGRSVNAIIDTGADVFILDTDVAAELGIEPVTSMTAIFAGGLQGEIGFARAGELKLGGVALRGVPISILPTKLLSLGGVEIGGIVGTSVLRQFLATLDYPNDRLVLRERTSASTASFLDENGASLADEVPFYLQGSHFILAHGSLNGHDGLLFHVDSGLAGVPSFGAPEQTLDYVGIPVPEVSVREDVIGGGGGGFAVGEFNIASLGLGRLVRHDLVGSFGGLPPGSYWNLGFALDGLISHNFLKEYSWTLDFDAMRMYFVRG